MSAITLETLELTPEEIEHSKETVRQMAFSRWINAGCPRCDGREFWLQAERDWIEHCYVPHRFFEHDGEEQPGS